MEKILVDAGSGIRAGDVLVELDKAALKAQVAQAEAARAAAVARLAAMKAGPRAETVAAAEAAAKAARQRLADLEADGRPEAVAQAEANLAAARARLAQLRAGATPEQLAAAEAQVRLANNQRYLALAQADALLGSRLPNTFTPDQKEAQAGVTWEQGKIAEANLAALKAGATAEQVAQAQAAVDAAEQQVALARTPYSEATIQQAREAVAQAEAQAKLAASPYTEHDLAAAQAAVDQAGAAVGLARIQLSQATITAPFDGVVAQRLVAEGAMAGPTTPLLRLVSRDTQVVVSVEEARVGELQPGQSATIAVSAYPGRAFEATVASVAPGVDPKTRTVQVKLAPRDAEGKLREGMFAQVQLQLGGKENALLVPRAGLVQEGGAPVVFVVDGGTVRRRAVTTGLGDGKQVEVVAGLAEGEAVATSGLSAIEDGQEVIVQ
ncbi:MAG: efflux RND transporter periplasmic adaptor subunit [Armatimonadetes bacterium]|nr:efflux RND transporter periplasmic adaptor subunit [Armatimonadota bacterium]